MQRNAINSKADDDSNMILSVLCREEKPEIDFAQSTMSFNSREIPFDKRVSGMLILLARSCNGGLRRYSPGGIMAG